MQVDLKTRYLGFELRNPLVVSACPLGERLETVLKLEEFGAAAVVLPSLFVEQIEHEDLELHWQREYSSDRLAEALMYFPTEPEATADPDNYLQHIRAAKQALSVPLIASLNAGDKNGWVHYAQRIEQAGADALELNIYLIPTDPEVPGKEIEQRYLDIVGSVRRAITVPLAVKIGPFFSSMPNMAKKLIQAGADGLVLFNRFLQPDIELDTLQVNPHVVLSTSQELRLPLRWIAILRNQTRISLAATSGVHSSDDVVKLLLAGADVTMTASSLLEHGPQHLCVLLDGLRTWLEKNNYSSVQQIKGGLSQANYPDRTVFERCNYVEAIASYVGSQGKQ